MTLNITVVLISHKSKKKVLKFIENFSEKISVIVIENSADYTIKEDLNKIKKNIKLIFSENNGYGSAINLARKSVNTDYFIVFNPDVYDVSEDILKKFLDMGKELNDEYACIGPRYINISKKTLIQSNENKEIDTLPSISGASMFFNKKNFDLLNGFDENFFLYFEESDFCLRANKVNKNYQINNIKVKHNVGSSVSINNYKEKKEIEKLRNWHFIWSKFYYYKKNYGFVYSLIYFIPTLLRVIFRIILYTLIRNSEKREKYLIRFNGLLNSIKGMKSYKRINNK